MSKVPKFHRNQNLVINNGNDIFKKKNGHTLISLFCIEAVVSKIMLTLKWGKKRKETSEKELGAFFLYSTHISLFYCRNKNGGKSKNIGMYLFSFSPITSKLRTSLNDS